MFLIVGSLIGLNLMIRIILSEARELRTKGQVTEKGRPWLTGRDVVMIGYRAGLFLMVPMGIGFGLDLIFGSTVDQIFS